MRGTHVLRWSCWGGLGRAGEGWAAGEELQAGCSHCTAVLLVAVSACCTALFFSTGHTVVGLIGDGCMEHIHVW